MVSDTSGGFLVRRLLVVALVVPPLFGWLRLWGERAGLYDSATGTSLLVIALMLVVGLVIWVSAGSLDAVDRHRRALFDSERQARAAAETALEVREEFLSSASHELRTPLQVLKLQLQLLERAHGETAAAPLATGIRKAALQVDRLVQLVHRLLDVSRLDSARVHLELEELDLAALVEEMVDRLRDQAAPGQLRAQTPGPVVGMWDRLRLEQVLTNLVSNAVKYGRGAPVEVAMSTNAAEVELSVRDRGIGISEEDQRRLFHRFERAVPTRSYAGFGLGLWICRELARAHGGDIRVESRLGEGATFTVRLPRRAAGSISYPAGTATG
jgi:signal transduction histidine kinase